MSEKLDRILEYCDLLTRASSGGLTEGIERARFERLRDQLSSRIPSLDERDPYTLLGTPLPAQIVTPSAVLTGQVRNAAGGGIALSVDTTPPALSEIVKVTARDVQRGIEYAFAGTVVARVVKGSYGFSLAFGGAPARMRLGGQSGVYPKGGATEIPSVRPNKRAGARDRES
jgi:hypothetical protein